MISAYTHELIKQRDRANADRRAAEDELGKHRRERADLIERTRAAKARADGLANTLDAVLRTFVHQVHPGYAGLQSMMVPVAEVEGWHQALVSARADCPDPIESDHGHASEDARSMLLNLLAQWGMRSGHGSRAIVDEALRRHAAELERAATTALTERAEQAEARIAAVRTLAADMRTWCSPHGIASDYADRIDAALDQTTR